MCYTLRHLALHLHAFSSLLLIILLYLIGTASTNLTNQLLNITQFTYIGSANFVRVPRTNYLLTTVTVKTQVVDSPAASEAL